MYLLDGKSCILLRLKLDVPITFGSVVFVQRHLRTHDWSKAHEVRVQVLVVPLVLDESLDKDVFSLFVLWQLGLRRQSHEFERVWKQTTYTALYLRVAVLSQSLLCYSV